MLHDNDDDDADVTPQGRSDFVALGLTKEITTMLLKNTSTRQHVKPSFRFLSASASSHSHHRKLRQVGEREAHKGGGVQKL